MHTRYGSRVSGHRERRARQPNEEPPTSFRWHMAEHPPVAFGVTTITTCWLALAFGTVRSAHSV
jgi:hypothetical protein